MLATSYVYETPEGYFCKHNAFFINPEGIYVDQTCFDEISCSDWIKQLKNIGIKTYVFVGGSTRLKAFVTFLNNHTDIQFYSLNDREETLPQGIASLFFKWCNLPHTTLNQLHQLYRKTYEIKAHKHWQRFLMGCLQDKASKDTIYYIMLGKTVKMKDLSTTILLNCSINATFYVSDFEVCSNNPFIEMPFDESRFYNESVRYSQNHMDQIYSTFVKEGLLPKHTEKLVMDIAPQLYDFHLKRLIVEPTGIYLDLFRHYPVGETKCASYERLKRLLKRLVKGNVVPMYYEAFISILCDTMFGEGSRFYLIGNAFEDTTDFAHYVGIQKGFECFVYNAHNHKAYVVSNAFLNQIAHPPKRDTALQLRRLLKEKFV